MTISERIFERLKKLDMTQKEFAAKTGIKESTISEWKKNQDKCDGFLPKANVNGFLIACAPFIGRQVVL